jgi:TolB-like protein/Tfp pilus assembly protein PilF
MKQCPECKRVYDDESLKFCLDDGDVLVYGPAEPKTAILPSERRTLLFDPPNATVPSPRKATETAVVKGRRNWLIAGAISLILIGAIGVGAYWLYTDASRKRIESLAVMPFVNETGNADMEYLSDGITDSLINSLSKIPHLTVKARSTVFHYKNQSFDPATVGKELAVPAVLSGRVVQRGDDLAVYLSLVDTKTGDQIWGESYERKLADLVVLQKQITREVSQQLDLRLSGAEVQRVTKSVTENAEAYQLYLKGRHHLMKSTPPEIEAAVKYFQEAIDLDPAYAMAYVGLADAYRAPGAERFPAEALTTSKAAAQKAIELDDTLADAHAILGFIIFWYEWNWAESEKECRRAIELDPNNSDAHLFYAHLLSNLLRNDEALNEARRARELDPLNVRTNALEGQFLLHAGRVDEALARLKMTKELDPDNWMAHLFATSAYIEKGMYAEAIAEGRRTNEIQPHSRSFSFLGYALAKSGNHAAARSELANMLEQSKAKWVSPYSVALVYAGLDDREQTLEWLERGLQQRDPRMVFLQAEPKWNVFRDDPRFQRILRSVGFPASTAR